MTHNRFSKFTHSRLAIATSLSLIATMVIAVAVFAAIYTISTTDHTVAEWDNQGIAVFQTDPTGDTVNGGTNQDDIIEARVATGDGGSTLYFLLRTAAGPAVNAPGHSAAASIDCDRDGVDREADDRLVAHAPDFYGQGERNILSDGIESYYSFLGPDAGQQVNDYIEWSVPVSDLPSGCQDAVNIKFYTAIIPQTGGASTMLDETATLRGWNIPTAVELKNVEAQSSVPGSAVLLAVAVGFIGAAGITAWLLRRRLA